MKRLIFVWSLVVCHWSFAQAPSLINYQGRLTDGTNLVNGTVNMELILYNSPSGGGFQYMDTGTVTVVDGLYSTFLGDGTALGTLTNALIQTNVFLEVTVNGVTLTPRERVASVAYALRAGVANSVSANGITASMIATGAVQGYHLATGSVGSAAIADGAVGAADLASNSVTTAAIADGAVGAADLAVNSVTTAAIADGAVTAVKVKKADSLFSFHANISNPTPLAGDYFGYAVAGFGSGRFLVGAPLDDAGAPDAGSVYLYDQNESLLATITNPAPATNDYFGWSVAGIGSNRFIVGAFYDNAGGIDAGSVYLYDPNGSLLATITNPAPATNDYFGRSVAGIGSNRFLVGASEDDAGAEAAGSVYLYDLNGSLLATIPNPAPEEGDQFGYSVAGIGSSHFVVGARFDGAISQGGAYLYDVNGTLLATITNPAPEAIDQFGGAVAGVGSSHFVVGAESDDVGVSSAGAAYLYDLNGTLVAVMTNPAPAALDRFGASVAGVGSNLFVVGAWSDRAGGLDAGSAYLFNLNGTLLDIIPNPASHAFDRFGISVAGIGSNRFIVGTELGGTATGGTAYVYMNKQHAEGLIAEGVQPGVVTEESLAMGIGVWTWSEGNLHFYDGNVGIGTTTPTNRLHVVGTVQANAYITTSDRNVKENIQPVVADEILQKVSSLPIATWNFKEDSSGTHLGPMAQDFRAAFGLGNTDSGIFTVDADGISLAAIQALYQIVQDQQKRIEELERKLGADGQP